jgi:hypothetical protein
MRIPYGIGVVVEVRHWSTLSGIVTGGVEDEILEATGPIRGEKKIFKHIPSEVGQLV